MKESNFNLMLSGGRFIVLLFAIFFGLGGFGMLYLQKANDENAWRLAHDGVTSLATITNKKTKTSHTTNKNTYAKGSGVTHYTLEYSFPLVGSDEEWLGNDDVSKEDFDSVKIGDQFDVVYWEEDPDIATILEDSYAAGAQLAKNISSVLFSLAIILVFILLIRPMRSAFAMKR